MRHVLNRLPIVLRLGLGLASVALFAVVGMGFWESNKVFAYVLLALAGLRLFSWFREVADAVRARRCGKGVAGRLVAGGDCPARWPDPCVAYILSCLLLLRGRLAPGVENEAGLIAGHTGT